MEIICISRTPKRMYIRMAKKKRMANNILAMDSNEE
jgi:hypothetical protein